MLTDEPVGYWRFGEPPDALTAEDEIGAVVGNYQGGVTLGFPGALAGDEDTAAVFDGVDDQVDFGDVHDFAGVSVLGRHHALIRACGPMPRIDTA